MNRRRLVLCIVLAATSTAAFGQGNAPVCWTDPVRGASTPQGAVATMRVVNTGASCSFANYGLPSSREHPADTGAVTQAARHGTAEFVPPRIRYRPDKGFVGDDEFSYEASATGTLDQRVHLKVTVKVSVSAP